METAILPTQTFSSYSRRLLAALIDAVVLIVPAWLGSRILPYVGPVLVGLLYGALFESSTGRATIGKHLCGIQVTDLSGRRITFRAAFVRQLVKLASSALCFIPYFVALFTARRQALHDLIAESVVVYGREEGSLWDAGMVQTRSVFRGAAQTIDSSTQLARLERLDALRKSGALSEEEFQREKQKILTEQQ